MTEPTSQQTADIRTAESADAAAISHEANSSARNAEIKAILEKVIAEQFQAEDKENEGNKRFINLGRVPMICQSILGIERRLQGIENNLSKGVWIVLTAFIGGLIMLLIK